MNKLVVEIFGGADPWLFGFWMLIAFISQYLTIYFRSKNKYQDATGTPSRFSLRFMTLDNLQKLLVGFLVAYIGLRASSVFFQTEASFIVALGIGPGSEIVANFFRKQESKARDSQ